MLPLAQEITQLELKLADAKRRWNILFGVAEAEKKTRSASPDGLTPKIIQFLEERRGNEFSIPEVAQSIHEDELPVGRALYRLANKEKKIANPSRGRYAALEKEVTSEETTS